MAEQSSSSGIALESVDAWWRAANYLSAAQIYLLDNPLLERALRPEDIKPRLLGHWGTIPALNLAWAHANRVIVERDLNGIFVAGPGHGGQAPVSNAWLEGGYSELFPEVGQDRDGLRRLVRQFSFPGGIPSHAAPETPGSINEGGELGYSLVHAYGAALDDPELTVFCVIGDGEAETATLAASWHLSRLRDPRGDGDVLPILNLNGWKIANPTLLSGLARDDLDALMRGYGYDPIHVEGDDPESVHVQLAEAMDVALDAFAHQRTAAHSSERRPMIVLRTPKGWTGPEEVDGLQVAGTWRAHQVPLDGVPENAAHLAELERWLRSYRPEELFDETGAPTGSLAALVPDGGRRMSMSIRANGGVRRELSLPPIEPHAVDVTEPGDEGASATAAAGGWLAELMRTNPRSFLLFGADEVASNKLDAVLDVADRRWIDDDRDGFSRSGRVIELLSENLLQGLAEGYALTGRHPVFTSYEAFIHVVDSMFNQHAKWIESASAVSWREPIPALTYLLSSHVWRQDHNGFSHQDPGFMDVVANKSAALTRILLPPDGNTLLATLHRALPERDVVNLVIAGKHPQPTWLAIDEAVRHVERGIGAWDWAGSGDDSTTDPDVVMLAAGDVPTMEAIAAVQLAARCAPGLRIRLVNLVDLMRLVRPEEHPHGLDAEGFRAVLTDDRPVVTAFHGYPSLVHQLLHGRSDPQRFHVHGFRERGSTTTPFHMLLLNDLDRYALASDLLRRGGVDDTGALEQLAREREEAREHALEHGLDHPTVTEWRFPAR